MLTHPSESPEIESRFEALRARFPELNSRIERPGVDGEFSLAFPVQPDLPFEIHLWLSGDELNLAAGAFWLEWFPANESVVLERFFLAASGLLSGEYRIVEYRRRGRAAKAVLERPGAAGWERVGTWSNPWAWLPCRRSTRILQRTASREAV